MGNACRKRRGDQEEDAEPLVAREPPRKPGAGQCRQPPPYVYPPEYTSPGKDDNGVATAATTPTPTGAQRPRATWETTPDSVTVNGVRYVRDAPVPDSASAFLNMLDKVQHLKDEHHTPVWPRIVTHGVPERPASRHRTGYIANVHQSVMRDTIPLYPSLTTSSIRFVRVSPPVIILPPPPPPPLPPMDPSDDAAWNVAYTNHAFQTLLWHIAMCNPSLLETEPVTVSAIASPASDATDANTHRTVVFSAPTKVPHAWVETTTIIKEAPAHMTDAEVATKAYGIGDNPFINQRVRETRVKRGTPYSVGAAIRHAPAHLTDAEVMKRVYGVCPGSRIFHDCVRETRKDGGHPHVPTETAC